MSGVYTSSIILTICAVQRIILFPILVGEQAAWTYESAEPLPPLPPGAWGGDRHL